uniref:Endonuclease V n=1 Tax=Thermorudis peleae TaxID=1382356 RepID=A0A831TCY3_9BACT
MTAGKTPGRPDLDQLRALQRELAAQVIERPLTHEPQVVAGADVHIAGGEAVAVAVATDADGLMVREVRELWRLVDFPYIPGFLSFREAPAIVDAVNSLEAMPNLLFVDGQGRAHPRRFGLACHVGVMLGIPTIGVAKSKLVGRYAEPGRERGSTAPLVDGTETIGMVVRTKTGAPPVFVSVGNLITLEEAVVWTLRLSRDRIPDPTLRAHQQAQRALATRRARES